MRFTGVLTLVLILGSAALATAQEELSYQQYRAMAWSADRLDHLASFEPLHGEKGMYLALAERFGTVIVLKNTARGVQREWKSNQLSGVPEEVLVADLSGDGFDDSLLCRTSSGKIYVWSLEDYSLIWESLPSDYTKIDCFTTANMDEDPSTEIVLIGDQKIVYIDGQSFVREYTSINDFQATIMRCGDVDGDGRQEIVLNSGKVVDSQTGSVKWEEQALFTYIELLDIDGDGIPEVLTENGQTGSLKVYDMDYGNEVRFQ